MRRVLSLAAVVSASALLLTAAPAPAPAGLPPADPESVLAEAFSARDQGGEWIPVPSGTFDVPAGARCDFPVHIEPIVDKVKKMVLATYPDGSPKRELYTGALVLRVTNTDTGASVEADVSGSGVGDYPPGGGFGTEGRFWSAGGVLIGIAEGGGNLPRGLYVVDGLFTLTISDTGFRTVTMSVGTKDNLCDDL
jgi:hypothetical protein